jgi:hypothetical protein
VFVSILMVVFSQAVEEIPTYVIFIGSAGTKLECGFSGLSKLFSRWYEIMIYS